ncbi:MAG: MFS transporter [Oscillospiraceae bacterium]
MTKKKVQAQEVIKLFKFLTERQRDVVEGIMTGMIIDNVFTKPQAGLIGTMFFMAYGVGQFINGFLGDKKSPFILIFIGLSVSALANITMAFTQNYILMLIIWGINGYVQSMIWSPILFILSNILHKDQTYNACINISTTVPAGTFCAYLFSLVAINFWGWKSVFIMGFLFLFLVSVLWVVGAKVVKKQLKKESALESVSLDSIKKEPNMLEKNIDKSKSLWKLLLIGGIFIIAIPVAIQGMLKDGVMTWVPTMMSEIFHVTPSFSLFLTMFIPVINLTGAYSASFLFRKYIHDEIKTAILFFGISLLGVIGLMFIKSTNIYFNDCLLSIVTSSMFAINALLITLVPVKFAKYGKASTVSGILNSIAYIGCAISNFGFGFFAENYGWVFTILTWVVLAVLAIVFCVVSLPKWKKFSKA